MWEQIFDFSTELQSISWQSLIATICIAFLLGVFISIFYIKTNKKGVYSQSFVTTLIMLPVIVALIILLIGSNVARAFSLAGAFSLIRFRSSMGDPKDIAYVFFSMAVGLALGVGFIMYSIVFAIALCLLMLLLHILDFGKKTAIVKTLKISIPENLDYQNVFSDILEKYTKNNTLARVRTTDLGSIYELTYEVILQDDSKEKSFIDELRCRNGNLTISIFRKELIA